MRRQSILFGHAILAKYARDAIGAFMKWFGRVYLPWTLGTREALLVEILRIEHQIRFIWRNSSPTFRARLALFARKAIDTIGLVFFVRVNALTNDRSRTLGAHQTMLVILVTFERHDRVQNGLRAFLAFARALGYILVVTMTA